MRGTNPNPVSSPLLLRANGMQQMPKHRGANPLTNSNNYNNHNSLTHQ
jgi:hypothetical protein